LYTPDGFLSPPGTNGATFTGREQITTFWKGAHGAGLAPLKLTVNDVTLHTYNTYGSNQTGDVMVEVSKYQHAKGSGNYIVIWKKLEGKWYLWKDLFNT